jgi:CubicO group peptidase (beta-lactamase class C family)
MGVLFSPQGGLRVSPIELSRLMRMLAQGGTFEGTTILQSTTVEQMLSEEWLYDGNNGDNYFNLFNSWGLGIQRTVNFTNGDIVLPQATCYGHAGEAYGLISDMYFAPELDFGIIFMTNGYYGSANYSFGESSAFYVPEEEAFAAINEWAVPICLQSTNQNYVPDNKEVSLYPNPTQDELFIASDYNIKRVTAIDFLGRTHSLSFDNGRVNTNSLLSGYYTFEIELENGKKWVELIMIL